MLLAGQVVSSEAPLSGDLVPAFVFRRQEVTDWNYRSQLPPGTQTNYFIRGEVSGSFPNAFKMSVFDAPPAAALKPMVKGEPPVMIGDFVAIPRDHPAQLIGRALPAVNPMSSNPFEDDANERIELCSETGQCIVKADNCPLGRPLPEGNFPCGPSMPDQPTWETRGNALQYMIMYASAALAADSYTAKYVGASAGLTAGYHLLTVDPPLRDGLPAPDTFQPADPSCEQQRQPLMFAELRRIGATGPDDALLDNDAYAEVRVRFVVDHPCPTDPVYRVADGTQPVNLTLSGPEIPFLFF